MLHSTYLFLVHFHIVLSSVSNIQNQIGRENMFTDLSKLIGDILYKIDAKHCNAIITDDLYSNILTEKFYDAMESKPAYIVHQILI